MAYRFSQRSVDNLKFVHPELAICASTSIIISKVDFAVYDGIRTYEEQIENIRNGVSWTMDSDHLPNHEGLSNAVDLVPYINGKLTWEDYDAFKEIARVMRLVAKFHRFELWWGANKQYGGDWETRNDMAHFYRAD